MTVGDRRGSRQMLHRTCSVTLPQTSQKRTFSLTSARSSESLAGSNDSVCRMWNAMRWADFGRCPAGDRTRRSGPGRCRRTSGAFLVQGGLLDELRAEDLTDDRLTVATGDRCPSDLGRGRPLRCLALLHRTGLLHAGLVRRGLLVLLRVGSAGRLRRLPGFEPDRPAARGGPRIGERALRRRTVRRRAGSRRPAGRHEPTASRTAPVSSTAPVPLPLRVPSPPSRRSAARSSADVPPHHRARRPDGAARRAPRRPRRRTPA